jgi:hypothetical protein
MSYRQDFLTSDDVDFNSVTSTSLVSLAVDDETKKKNSVRSIKIPMKTSKTRLKKSWVWCFFESASNGNKAFCFCTLCSTDIKYGLSRSTGMLERHIKNRHPQKYAEKVAEHVLQTLQLEVSQSSSSKSKSSDSKKTLSSYLIPYPGFEGALLKWMIENYQPLSVTECKEIQEMCQTLNTKAPLVGRDWVARLLSMEYHVV